MSDEKLSTAQRQPEKEEAAPAPASALGTATTSEDVINDITMSHDDTQAITAANITESPAGDAGAAPAGDALDSAQLRDAVMDRLAALPGKPSASDDLRGAFDALGDGDREFLRVWWEGRAKGRDLNRPDDLRACAVDVYRELEGAEPDDGFEQRWSQPLSDLVKIDCDISSWRWLCRVAVALGRAARTSTHPSAEVGRALARAGLAEAALSWRRQLEMGPEGTWNDRLAAMGVWHSDRPDFAGCGFETVGEAFARIFEHSARFLNRIAQKANEMCAGLVEQRYLELGSPAHMEALRVVRVALSRSPGVKLEETQAFASLLDPTDPIHAEVIHALKGNKRTVDLYAHGSLGDSEDGFAGSKVDCSGVARVLNQACGGYDLVSSGMDACDVSGEWYSLPSFRAAYVGSICALVASGKCSHAGDIRQASGLGSGQGAVLTLSDLAHYAVKVLTRKIFERETMLARVTPSKAERNALKWPVPKELTPFEAALLAMAYHHRPEHGVVWSVYADVRKPGGGNLKWRDPKTGAWGDFVINLGEGEFGGAMYEDFIALLPGGDARAFKEFRAHFTRFVEMYRKYDMKMARVKHDLASQWSLTNGGAKRLNRYTRKFVDVTDDPVELTANGAAIGIYLEDDGTGHAKFPENFVRETPDNNGVMRTFDANRDFFAAFAKPGEEEVVKDAILTVCGYWYGYDAGSREAVALIGVIGGAKSTLIKVLERSGSGNLATVPWSGLGERSKLFSLNGKAAMLSGEIGENIRSTTRVNFNMLTAHDTMSTHQLFVGDTQIDFCGPIIGASNMMPKTDDRTGAFESRVAVYDADHSVYDNEFYLPEVVEKFVFENEFQAWLLGLVCASHPSVRSVKESPNPKLRASNAKLADEIDWARQFLDVYLGNLDAQGVDGFYVQAAFEAYKVWYAREVGGKVVGSLNREFKQSFVRYVREHGWVVDLDARGQYAKKRMPDGFYEPRRVRAAVSEWIAPARFDAVGQPVAYGPDDLVKWVDYDQLVGHSGRRDGLLDRPQRGVCLRASAVEDYNERGWSPAARHHNEFLHEQKALLDRLTPDELKAYQDFCRQADELAGKGYRDADGFPYEVPGVREWDRMGCPVEVVYEDPAKPDAAKNLDVCLRLHRAGSKVRDDALLVRVHAKNVYPTLNDDVSDLTAADDLRVYAHKQTISDPRYCDRDDDDVVYEPVSPVRFDGDDDPNDDPSGPGGAAPTSSDAPEGADVPDETAAQGTCDASAPADGAHEAPAPSGKAPAANGTSAPAETPVSAAQAAVEGGDAAEEAPGAPEPGYEAFCAHAKDAVEHSGGYVVLDGGPEGATVCREVICEDEWAAYGRPTRLTRTVEVDSERLPLIE